MSHRLIALTTTFIIGTVFASFAAFAWSGPPCSDPNACNVEAPVNVSDNFQDKVGVLGLGGLAVFGNSSFDGGPEGTYLNFSSGLGANGYGFRDNAGTMEFKDSGDTDWTPFSDLVGGGDGGPSITIPTCGPGQVVTANGTAFTCTNVEQGNWCGLAYTIPLDGNGCRGPYGSGTRTDRPNTPKSVVQCKGGDVMTGCPAGYTRRFVGDRVGYIDEVTMDRGECYYACLKN